VINKVNSKRIFYLTLLTLLTTLFSVSSTLAEPWHENSGEAEYGAITIIPIDIQPWIPPVITLPTIPDFPIFEILTEYDYYLWTEHGGWWYDAEKTADNTDDDLMCWAASCSNALEWTGWGIVNDPNNGLLEDSDEMFQNFNYYWYDDGGFMSEGWAWWFDGTEYGSLETKPSGDYFATETYSDYYEEQWNKPDIMTTIDTLLHGGYAVTIGIRPTTGNGGHAITCWGYRYDITETGNDYYIGIWVSDSDDNKGSNTADPPPNTLRYYTLAYNSGSSRWEMTNYGGGWYIEAVMALSPRTDETRPIADAGASYTGTEGTPIAFSGSGSTDDDSLEYRWEFDGNNMWDTSWSSSSSSSHTWNDGYTGKVLLEVYDGTMKDVDEVTVTVLNVAPTVNAGTDKTVDEGDLVSFTGSYTDPGTADTHTIEWDFGDGSAKVTGTLTPTHTYADNGAYTVTLTVTDDDEGVGTDTLTVTVGNVPPTAEAGPDQTVNEGDLVSFTGSYTDPGTGDTHTIEWDFGDGTAASSSLTPSHVYADNGVYTVTLTVTDDDGGVGVDAMTVSVENVAPTVEAGADQTADEGGTVTLNPATFNDKGTLDTHSAVIDWGDGASEARTVSESPSGPPGSTSGSDGTVSGSHEYGDNGVYTVTVTITDDDGDEGVDTLTVTVSNVSPTVDTLASDQPNPQFILPGVHMIEFTATFSDPGWLDTHTAEWDWGDATTEAATLTEENIKPDATGTCTGTHTYSASGTYTVTITVSDDDGDPGSMPMEITVATAEEAVQDTNNYIQGLPGSAFKGKADQSKKALDNMFSAILNKLTQDSYSAAINQLESIRDKADGVGPDWIIDLTAQSHICMKIDDINAYLRSYT
jgi:PKD repeat protein